MAKSTQASCRRCRREGQKLFLKGDRCFSAKCAIVRRNFPPGIHGEKKRGRLVGYGAQLREKQKAKRTYGLRERQFRTYYEKSKQREGKTGELVLQMLEQRLDNTVYRAGFAVSRQQARQLISHAQVEVNGQCVNIPSMQVNVGDVIKVKETKQKNTYWSHWLKEGAKPAMEPTWLNVDRNKYSIALVSIPTLEQINSELQINLIIEYYSR